MYPQKNFGTQKIIFDFCTTFFAKKNISNATVGGGKMDIWVNLNDRFCIRTNLGEKLTILTKIPKKN